MISGFFRNRLVNFLTLHYGFQILASMIGEIFFGTYLYQLGFPLWMVFLTWGGIFLLRFLLRPLGLNLCWRYGIRRVLIAGTLTYALSFLVLAQVQTVGPWFFLMIAIDALTDVLYWFPYHTYYTITGDLEHRGKQIALRETAAFLAAFIAPLLGATLINFQGFDSAFGVATAIMLTALLPLLRLPDLPLPPRISRAEALETVGKDGFWWYFGDSIFAQAYNFTWRFVLFIFVGNYLAFGGLLSLAVLFQVIGVALVGHSVDAGNGRKIYPLGIVLMALVVIGRVFFTNSVPQVIFLDALYALASLLYSPIMIAAFYNTAKKSRHPLWFQFFAESGWDIGSMVAAFSAAAFLFFDGDLRFILLFSLPGLGLMAFRLWKHHSEG